jgi:hypothetical protein
MSPAVLYVYGVVGTPLELARAPQGIDDAPLRPVADGPVAALVSELDGERYAPEAVERGTEEVEWLAPRAIAHDRVLTWASDRGPVVPLPMFSLFSSEEAIRVMLRERALQLAGALRRAAEGREYALRVYRVDPELAAVAAELSPRLADLERAASVAAPGQRYLLERKLESERKKEVQAIGARTSREVIAVLAPHALAYKQGPAVRRDAGGAATEPALVLDTAFLVSPALYESFRGELTRLVERHASRGFRFDFTGPWPLYHFVQDVDEEPTRGG